MHIPASSLFTTVPLTGLFNAQRQQLGDSLRLAEGDSWSYGAQSFLGIPFTLGSPDAPNLILLDREAVQIPLDNVQATYLIFVHVVVDHRQPLPADLADLIGNVPLAAPLTGNELGGLVSEYRLEYVDGTSETIPIRRRFAIQQAHVGYGANPFAAISANAPRIVLPVTDSQIVGTPAPQYWWGEMRHSSPRDSAREHLWLYALPNPHPDKSIQCVTCTPKEERSAIYALSYTQVTSHPLRPGTRQKLKLTLPEQVRLNAIGETNAIAIDLGMVISARAVLDYDRQRWFSPEANTQPTRSDREVVVEYIAHPQAKLYVECNGERIAYDLAALRRDDLVHINPAIHPVRLRILDRATGQPVPVRLHLHGAAGEYLPPKANHRKVNPHWFEDNYGEFVNSQNQYCYIRGECEVDLPLGEVFIELTRGYEVAPLRGSFTVTPETSEVTFELERVLHWRERGWVTADTHVHFLSPQTALLEGAAEEVNVVNLLASQWGEMFSNVSDFDGSTTLGAKDFGGEGEFMVRVGTENRMQVLGHISLLGYSGAMIQPLCSGGPSESAIGDPLEVTMADWARQCIEQNGLVVLPHAPVPQGERAADIVLGLIHAIEMKTHNPFSEGQITPYGLADWYRFLNLGYHIPVVGGSDKMRAADLLGGIRTYVHLGGRELTYTNWMDAVKEGNTFVTVGPLAEMTVEGLPPGRQLELPTGGGHVNVSWQVQSANMPLERVEVVVGGLAAVESIVDGALQAEGSAELTITDATWIALRVRGSYRNNPGEIAAHTSAVQVLLAGKRAYSPSDAMAVLEQIEGAIAYVDTLAPQPEARHYQRLRATLESAYNRHHQMMHRQGIYHKHTPLNQHDTHHEHR